jgi:hypothetical protein
MDIISHGLWGGIALGRKKKSYFWWAFAISIFPDAISFGILMVIRIFGLGGNVEAARDNLSMGQIPHFINWLYNISHSFFVFGLVFFIVWLLLKKPFWPLLAWGLHILIDIPSHSFAFFPTPFLWPFSNFKVNGISWGEPVVFFSDVTLLVLAYIIWFIVYRKKSK